MIIEYIRKYGKAKKKDIRELLWDKIPDVFDDKKKNSKIFTLLTSLKQKGQITKDSPNQQISNWILVGMVKKPIRNELNSNKLSLRITEKALGYGFSELDRK